MARQGQTVNTRGQLCQTPKGLGPKEHIFALTI